jgi:hypothetical protein
MTTTEALAAYMKLSKCVFSERKHFRQDAHFKATNLEQAIKEIVTQYGGMNEESEKMLETRDDSCKTYWNQTPLGCVWF